MGEAVDLLQQAQEDDEAHEHLRRGCPWFRHVGEGGGLEDIERHCQPMGRTKALVKFTADGVDWVVLTPRTPEASTVHQPTVPPGGPGLFHVKGLQLPAYVQHLYKHLVGRYGKHGAYRVAVGVVKKWAQGIHPGGKGGKQGRVHADVQAAAGKNVAEWEKDKETAHEHRVAATGLSPASQTPGAQAQYGLWQHPAATVSPGPPLPPKVPMPTPTEVRSLAGLVPPTNGDTSLTRTVRKFIETAAVKLEHNTPLEALQSLRGAQAAVYAAHKNDLEAQPPVPWTAPSAYYRVLPAAQSSATAAMKQSRDRTMAYRKLDVAVGGLLDRIRKNYFHGPVFSGPSTPLRLSQEDEMSAVDRLIELMGAGGAGSSAGSSAGRAPGVLPSHSSTPAPGGRPRARLDHHQLHVLHKEHLSHLHRLHQMHLEHLEHLHGQP